MQEAVLVAELQQLRLDDEQALADAEQTLADEREEHSVEKRKLEEIITKTAKKNRELTARLESSDSSASSHSERMKELTDENRALMKEKNDSSVEAAASRKELQRALDALDEADRMMEGLQAEKGENGDQLSLVRQQLSQLTQEKEAVSAELEAAYENTGELKLKNDEALAELAQLKSGAANATAAAGGNVAAVPGGAGTEAAAAAAEGRARVTQLEAALTEAEAKRAQAEAARLDWETKVRQALITAKATQDRLTAETARLKAELAQVVPVPVPS